MDFNGGHVSEEHIVRLILLWHKHYENAIEKLNHRIVIALDIIETFWRRLTCDPFREEVPIYRNTPKRTGIGILWSIGVKSTDSPTNVKMHIWVTRCSRTPRNCGFSPGAELSDSILSELTWVIERTVAATNQGNPINEQIAIRIESTNRSKW